MLSLLDRYGDLSPKTSAGRAFFIVWALFGVGTLTILFSVVSDAWASQVQQKKLAGVAVEKKDSLWSRLTKKVKGNRGRDDVPKGAGAEEEAIGSARPASVIDGEGEKGQQDVDADSKSGGILLDPGTTVQTGSSSANSSEESESVEDIDVNQLHLDFTTAAMEFHNTALDLYHQNAQGVVETFQHVPEVREVVLRQSQEQNRRVTDDERKSLLDAVRDQNDSKALQSIQQWLSIQDFERK